ncbi:hypothetical protein HPB51_024103 [Rhipicephalus microplus]|uniref:PLD phosphodiesterase domain-containing protein n=1 Tax=Rhipicephalus microplus TaxID=6941 RepID=A0A9J6ED67_RHIMP|nr:hypothetical protein HPB51_024103 [Rhipicephalus microplus]
MTGWKLLSLDFAELRSVGLGVLLSGQVGAIFAKLTSTKNDDEGRKYNRTDAELPTELNSRKTVLDSAGKLDFGEFELQLFDSRYMNKRSQTSDSMKLGNWLKPSCIPITIILLLIVLVVLFPLLGHSRDGGFASKSAGKNGRPINCLDSCSGLVIDNVCAGFFPKQLQALVEHLHCTYDGWKTLLQLATKEIKIASFYWTLRGSDIYEDPSDWQGEDIFKEIVMAGKNRSVDIKIAQNMPREKEPNLDTQDLVSQGIATVRSVDFDHLMGAGVLHTKFWIVDNKHIYVGSANMDWRSLTQVKELGALILNCGCLAQDLNKVFQVYWDLGVPNATVPAHWPADLSTDINVETPADVDFNGTSTQTYFSKLFEVPAFTPEQELIPFGRVNHNKYMVTDNKAYIGTSNWTPGYFINTGGVGLVMDQSGNNDTSSSQPIREQLNSVFERDWNSPYARWL